MQKSAASANVILAKARAMYGNSLRAKNYAELLQCHSVSEVAAYLKTRTAYAAVLADINESTIHRGHLEQLLRRKLFHEYASLSRYDMTVGMRLGSYIIMQREIDEILHCLQLMFSGHTDEFFLSMPLYFNNHTHLDLLKMGQVKTQEELTELLVGTPYADILRQFPAENGVIRLTEMETALHRHLTKTLFDILDSTSGELHQQLVDLCGTQTDTQNVTRIMRLKKFFDTSPDSIRTNLLPSGRCLSPKVLERMLAAPTADEVMSLFLSTTVGKRLPEEQRQFLYDLDYRVPYFNARHHIHFSVHPMVVLLSYMILTDRELKNIVTIIEGIRYELPPEMIRPMLVFSEQ